MKSELVAISFVKSVKDNSDGGIKRVRVIFENGLGISVIIGPYTYGGSEGLYEIAPLNIKGGIDGSILGWEDDVKGYLTTNEVIEYAKQIALIK